MKANRFAADETAVTDIVGSILLVAITVSMMVGLSVVVLSIDGPSDHSYTELRFEALPGVGGWGTGDEAIRMTHAGGEAMKREDLNVIVTVAGVRTQYGPADFDGDLADGKFSIGESWTKTHTIQEKDIVKATAIFQGRNVITLSTLRSPEGALDCTSDTVSPSVLTWQQTPNDVNTFTVGPVTVTVTLTDNCSGPDDSVAPTLQFRVGTDPWTDAGMTLIGPGQWSGNVAAHNWALRAGENLEYHVINFADLNGNSGSSTTQIDVINTVDPVQYVDNHAVVEGKVTSFSNAQSDMPLNQVAELEEFGGRQPLYATTSMGVAGHPSARYAPDDAYTTLTSTLQFVTVSAMDVVGQSGTITKVELAIDSHRTLAGQNDVLQLEARAPGGSWYIASSGHNPNPLTDTTVIFDITGAKAGSWSWSDVAGTELRATYVKNGAEDADDMRIDSVFAMVTTAEVNSLNVEFLWDPLVPLPTHTLEIRYRAPVDTFRLQVWDGAAWTTRGNLDQNSMTDFSYVLTASEAAGSPKVRFIDDSNNAPSGVLHIDYARIVSA